MVQITSNSRNLTPELISQYMLNAYASNTPSEYFSKVSSRWISDDQISFPYGGNAISYNHKFTGTGFVAGESGGVTSGIVNNYTLVFHKIVQHRVVESITINIENINLSIEELTQMQSFASLFNGDDVFTYDPTLGSTNPLKVTIDAGAGDDKIHLKDDVREIDITMGEGADTVYQEVMAGSQNGLRTIKDFDPLVDKIQVTNSEQSYQLVATQTGVVLQGVNDSAQLFLIENVTLNDVQLVDGVLMGITGDSDDGTPSQDVNVIVGTDAGEIVVGTDADDVVVLLGGDDIYQDAYTLGDDVIYGGTGNDEIYAKQGDDSLFGDMGDDILFGGEGDDHIVGGTGNDLLIGGDGHDFMEGGYGNDRLTAGTGDDVLLGDMGDDELDGGAGSDALIGGGGDDVIFGGAGDDYISGGAGHDGLIGGDGDDFIEAGAGSDFIVGGKGNDGIFLGEGEDIILFQSDGHGGSFGIDTVFDFELGVDKILIEDTTLSFNDLRQSMTQVGNATLLEIGNSALILEEVEMADISETDFYIG